MHPMANSENVEAMNLSSLISGSKCGLEICELNSNRREHAAALILWRRSIDITENIQTLLDAGRTGALPILLRNLLELLFSVRYLTQDDYSRRAKTWLYFNLLGEKKLRQHFDPGSDVGRKFRESSEQFSDGETFREHLDAVFNNDKVRMVIKEIEGDLASDYFADIKSEFDRKAKKGYWFNLFDGPPDHERLAKAVNLHPLYLFYRTWSRHVHCMESQDLFSVDQFGRTHLTYEPVFYKPEFLSLATNALFNRISKILLEHFKKIPGIRSEFEREFRDAGIRIPPFSGKQP
jgi:hypothetical protein